MSKEYNDRIVILRSAWGKVGSEIIINPCRDPKTGQYPPCVRPVNSKGEMLLSEQDKADLFSNKVYLVPENEKITIHDGITFNLDNLREAALWACIEHCFYIAPDRYAKDSAGNYLIDGTMGWKNPHPRYGVAEFYIEHPGLESARRVKRTSVLAEALKYILDDSAEGRITRAKLLGKRMENVPDADVTDYLMQIAQKNPEKITTLYKDPKSKLRILLIDAKAKNVVIMRDQIYWYGDNVLGTTDEAALTWLSDEKNAKAKGLLMREVYPHLYAEQKNTIEPNPKEESKEEKKGTKTTK